MKIRSRKEKPKSEWSDAEWNEYVEEAHRMHELAIQNPNWLHVEWWQEEIRKRTAGRQVHYGEEGIRPTPSWT